MRGRAEPYKGESTHRIACDDVSSLRHQIFATRSVTTFRVASSQLFFWDMVL
jgi:hypothetical protein